MEYQISKNSVHYIISNRWTGPPLWGGNDQRNSTLKWKHGIEEGKKNDKGLSNDRLYTFFQLYENCMWKLYGGGMKKEN